MRRIGLGIMLVIFVVAFHGRAIGQEKPTMEEAMALVQQQNWKAAAEAFETITKTERDNGLAWYYLGYSRHAMGDLSGAIEAGKKATQFDGVKASAFYNLACAYALEGQKTEAHRALDQAMDVGFLDYDLLKTDNDLDPIRDDGFIAFPPESDYEEIRARNDIVLEYHILLPDGFDVSKTYPALVAFPPGSGGKAAADWMIAELWNGKTADMGWIVVSPVAPDRGWINHPAHHALNDLLDHVQKRYKIEKGKFHMAGFAEGGQPAATFSLMSSEYFQSLTTVSTYSWYTWDDEDFEGFTNMPVHLIVGGEDDYGVRVAKRVKAQLDKNGATSTLLVADGDGYLLKSLRGGVLLEHIAKSVR